MQMLMQLWRTEFELIGINSDSRYHCFQIGITEMRGRLYSSCVQSHTLHDSETWPVRKNKVALQHA